MRTAKQSRDYTLNKARPGPALDRHQKWVQDTYHELIEYVVRDNPWSNINQITQRTGEVRDRWFKETKARRENGERKLPKGGPTRKTVSIHLKTLVAENRVAEVGGLYASSYDYVKRESLPLAVSVRKLFKRGVFDSWSFIPATKAAGFFTLAQPDPYHFAIQDLKELQERRFGDNLFWLDDILRDAICTGRISPKLYSNGIVDVDALKEGWKRYFGSTDVYVLAAAINPAEFLQFLVSHSGQVLLTKWLESNWSRIREEVDADVARLNLGKIVWEAAN